MRGKRRGQIAGHIGTNGYRKISIDGRAYGGNQIAWLYMTGELPKALIDHKDGKHSNDRWANLRPANHSQNMANKKRHRGQKSGFKGVYPSGPKWVAIVTAQHVRHYLGSFAAPELAHAAYCRKAIELHGPFARFD